MDTTGHTRHKSWKPHALAHRLHAVTWWDYVQRIAGTASPSEISRRTGIGQSSIGRWGGASPKPESVATFAEAYGRPVLEAFIAAGFLTEEQAKVTKVAVDAADLDTKALIEKLHQFADELARRAGD